MVFCRDLKWRRPGLRFRGAGRLPVVGQLPEDSELKRFYIPMSLISRCLDFVQDCFRLSVIVLAP